jgi:transcription-repair coupling factor (superfamily II helicase)
MNSSHSTLFVPELGSGLVLDQVVRDAVDRRRFDLAGADGGSLALFLVRLNASCAEPIVVVTADMKRARRMVRDLIYHLNATSRADLSREVLLFPAFDLGPYDELVPDRLNVVQRAATLFKLAYGIQWRFLVIPADALLRKVVPKTVFADVCMPVEVGKDVERDDLVECLERGGYHRAPLVEEPGTYAVRGSLIDVFPSYLDRPVRCDLFGSEVEKIRSFDPETQTSEAGLDKIWIHPVRLALCPQDKHSRSMVASRIRAICDAVDQPTFQTEQIIEDILEGRLMVGSDSWAPAFHSSLGSLLDYLPEQSRFCLENPEGIQAAWEKEVASIFRNFRGRQENGFPAFSPDQHLIESSVAEAFFESQKCVAAHSLAVVGGGAMGIGRTPIDLKATSTVDLGERLRNSVPTGKDVDLIGPLSTYLRDLSKEGYRVRIVARTEGQAHRLVAMLKGRGLKVAKKVEDNRKSTFRIGVFVGELARGCLLPADGSAWIAEEEVFGKRARRRRRTRRLSVSLDDLRMLKPGDLVVHAEHGIGRYEGLVRRRIHAAEMDFLLIAYRGGDRLYLPVYRMNQVQKYKGGEGGPRLDKLGGQDFARTTAEVRKVAQAMAGQLLDIYARRAATSREPLGALDDLYRSFEAGFPFEETDDQARAIDDVMCDLEREQPMDRLVCGDVGFGKTEVALRAAFRIVMGGRQVAILVPTTVLAQQHAQTFRARFEQYPVRVEVLSRFRSQKQNQEVVLGIKEGTVDIVIGTHRLLSKDVHFRRLGLLTIDEEHRFGVAHKERIRALRSAVDTLVMTATPIPRTLQMAFGGVRDLSLIGTAPAERQAVKTHICHDEPQVLTQAMERELAREGQVFFVHNRVKDIGRVAERVRRMIPEARVVVGHGQMKEDKLEQVMLDFIAGRYDILVCTSIIESGLDIPRSNTIIIDRADMFGMAQLYQLRGRVGRSNVQAYAYLVVPPVSILSDEAKARVETLARHTELGSGFSVATMDMELRGAGNLLGAEQSGNVSMVGFDMFCDLLAEATAEIRGEMPVSDVEPELTFEKPGFIPEAYVPDVGQRLQFYKRLASAGCEEDVETIAAELVDRCGVLPIETEELVRGMVVKSLARRLGIRGVESSAKKLILHLAQDSKVEPEEVMKIIREDRGLVQLTPDLKIVVLFKDEDSGGAVGAIAFLHRLNGSHVAS